MTRWAITVGAALFVTSLVTAQPQIPAELQSLADTEQRSQRRRRQRGYAIRSSSTSTTTRSRSTRRRYPRRHSSARGRHGRSPSTS